MPGAEPTDALLTQSEQGVFGLAEVLADFDEADLHRLRAVAEVIRTPRREGVRSAIALAGSAAQSRFQPYPGDCDYFERVHIRAPTREAALATLVSCMVETIARAFTHEHLQFTEMKLGLHDRERRRGGDALRAGSPITWTLIEVDARSIVVEQDGEEAILELGAVVGDPGFVKLDWVMADPERDRVVPVSKVIDATWETPEGGVVALDGVLDSFYQEVYLEPESRPHVERLIEEVRPDGLGEYVAMLEREIHRYTEPDHLSYGKVAKRLYNIFRLTNRPGPAAHVRGLFDDPPARLYQVSATLYALEPALASRRLDRAVVSAQLAELEELLGHHYEGDDRDALLEAVRALPALAPAEREAAAEHVTERVNAQVSDYFAAQLRAHPEVAAYLDSLSRP